MSTELEQLHARTRRGRWSPPAIPSSPSRSTLADDNQILRLDIPALGVDGVCLSIIGQLGQSRGVLIFLSREDFKQFIEAAAKSDTEQPGAAFGAEVLSLTFHNATSVAGDHAPRGTMQHRWPVNSQMPTPRRRSARPPTAYPAPSSGATSRPSPAAALALSAFLPKHAAIFKSDTFAPVCESYFDDEDREVRFTVPYEAFDIDESADQDRGA